MIKVSDLTSGVIVATVGLAILVESTTFPAAAGVPIGPSIYPGLVGAVLIGCGLVLAGIGLRAGEALPLAERPAWMRPGEPLLGVVAIPIAITAYALLAYRLGFIATSCPVLFGLLLAFGVRLRTSAFVAIGVTITLHLVFAEMMRVPLPYGFIERLLP